MRLRLVGAVVTAVLSSSMIAVSPVSAATPGWECVPVTSGKPVVSGGTAATPSCSAGSTAVLAPTYVASGPGGKPAVQFSAVNLQIVSGSGSTNATPTGVGNVVIGYDEGSGAKTGSHNLILGRGQAYTSYGSIIAGATNTDNAAEAVLFGYQNTANAALASVTGGRMNTAGAN